jgi:ATP-dependent Clp protease adaptor protein ClpS
LPANAEVETIPESLIRDLTGSDSPWTVILFNDEVHTFDEVAFQLQKAIGCDLQTGYTFAAQVHTTGRANVFQGVLDSCERVAAVLEEIALMVRLQVL